MSISRSGAPGRVWRDFQTIFSEFTGLSIQAFDARGAAIQPSPPLPPLCAFLQRTAETQVACQKDCFRKAASCRDSRRILAARCYAGLSYRIVPIRRHGRPSVVVLVGRVLTEVLGEEQRRGFIERYKVPPQAFFESQAGLRSIGTTDLDRVASFVRTLAMGFEAADMRGEHRSRQLARRKELVDFARKATAFHGRDPGQFRELLEFLCGMFAASGAAVLVQGEPGAGRSVLVSVGLGEESLHEISNHDWPRLFEGEVDRSTLSFANREAMIRAGLDAGFPALSVQRLTHGPWAVGYLVLAGTSLAAKDERFLEAASGFISSRIVHQHCRDIVDQREQESAMLTRLAERVLSARDVEEILPLALEAAMHTLKARRGSILLAEERGRITARALRGDHAAISGSIQTLPPGSVSHRVFFERNPILVQDVDREPGLKSERQFPYSTRSFVSVPLRQNGHALGVLHLTDREGAEVFTLRDLAWLEQLSVHAAGAIHKVRLEEEVRSLRVASSVDHLTGVYNRRHLEEHLAIELARARRSGQPLAVAMFDLDDFKALNDASGHDYGDTVLKEVADVVRKQLRSVDIIARYGGDEFVLVLPGTGAAGAARLAEKIRARLGITEPPGEGRERRACTVSIGIAVYPDTAAGADELLRQADQALLQAKKSGRNAALTWPIVTA